MKEGINNIGLDVQKLINQCGLKEKFRLFCLQTKWNDVAGNFLASHSYPQKLFDNQLTIHTDSAVISNELFFLKDKLKEKITLLNIEIDIEKIFIRVGRITNEAKQKEAVESSDNTNIELDEDDIIFVSMFSRNFENSEIYPWARQIALNYTKNNKKKIIEGWKKCGVCGAFVKNGNLCDTCGIREKIENRKQIRGLLIKYPWLSYQEMREKIFISQKRYEREKKILISDLSDKNDKNDTKLIIMLMKSVRIENITAEMIFEYENGKMLRYKCQKK